MAATYFTCTLGQAQSLGLTNSKFKNINQFIDSQAEAIPSQPAVGFAIPSTSDSQWKSNIWTFSDLQEGSERSRLCCRRRMENFYQNQTRLH
ncbi:unnamed protein product [Aureobasidium pullulans]|nr:unnamed protein product [Aureobasidium pullulans]CAD0032174.1 unnamed protein product [Aureobasidium pullulans]